MERCESYRLRPETVTSILDHLKDSNCGNAKLFAWARPGRVGAPSRWVTSAYAVALNRVVRMVSVHINRRVLSHMKHRRVERRPAIRDLVCGDIGTSTLFKFASPTTLQLERIRAQLALGPRAGPRALSSLIVYGPPGTGKTTLAEAVCSSSRRTLVEITPSEILKLGSEQLETQADAVMTSLAMLSDCLILFDEFDRVLATRNSGAVGASSVFDFLTDNMLPKLSNLHRQAGRRRIAYILATNYIDRLDAAAIRDGRFDEKNFVSYPDVPARYVRLGWQVARVSLWLKEHEDRRKPHAPKAAIEVAPGLRVTSDRCDPEWATEVKRRLVIATARSSQVSIAKLARKGWLRGPDPEGVALRGEALDSIWPWMLQPVEGKIERPDPIVPDAPYLWLGEPGDDSNIGAWLKSNQPPGSFPIPRSFLQRHEDTMLIVTRIGLSRLARMWNRDLARHVALWIKGALSGSDLLDALTLASPLWKNTERAREEMLAWRQYVEQYRVEA